MWFCASVLHAAPNGAAHIRNLEAINMLLLWSKAQTNEEDFRAKLERLKDSDLQPFGYRSNLAGLPLTIVELFRYLVLASNGRTVPSFNQLRYQDNHERPIADRGCAYY